MHYVDLTHAFGKEMPTYPGDPPVELVQVADFDTAGCMASQVKTGMHVGTHMDAPLHFIPGGKKIADFPPERFVGRGVLLDARGLSRIDADIIMGSEAGEGDIVLVWSGFYERFRQPEYFRDYPELTEALGRELVRRKVKAVGVDFPSPDREPFPLHKILLGSEVLIIENLANLAALAAVPEFEVFAFPVKFEAEAAPVRVVARVSS